MEAVKKLEKIIEGWLKPIPHLPSTWRKWLGENVWWLVLIGTILSGIAILTGIGALLTALSLMGAATSFYGYYYAQAFDGMWMFSSIVSLAGLVLSVVLMAMAINPLKDQKKKGWDLLFISTVVSVAVNVLALVINFNMYTLVPGLIGAAIGAGIGMYLLFEIKSHFNAATVVHKAK